MELIKSWGKLLIMGEHAILQGHPAVGAGLPLELKLLYEPHEDGKWKWQGIPEIHLPLLYELVHRLVEWGPAPTPQPGMLTLVSDVPLSAGFGSSATLCVALSRALYPHLHSKELWTLANRAEGLFHGTPSGIDTALAVYGGLLGFLPDTPLPHLEPLKGFPFSLVAVSHPRTSSTKILVAELIKKLQDKDKIATSSMEKLGKICRETFTLFQNPPAFDPIESLSQLILQAQEQLSVLGLSTPALNHLNSLALERGALGGKLSGAGGGGAQFFLVRDSEQATILAQEIERAAKKNHIQLTLPPTPFVLKPPHFFPVGAES